MTGTPLEPPEIDEPAVGAKLRELLERGDSAAVRTLIEALDDPDRVHTFARLSAEQRSSVLGMLDREHAAELLEQVPDSHAVAALEQLEPKQAAEILEQLHSDERADLYGQLAPESAEAILAEAAPETAADVRALLRYDPDTAGGRMVTEVATVPETASAEDVVRELRANATRYAHFVAMYVYVVGARGELRGVLRLRDLLLAPPRQPVSALMLREPISVAPTASLAQLFEVFDRYPFLGLPVVDEDARILGVLLREAVDEARLDRAEAEGRMARGIVGGEELRSLPVLLRARRRLSWLSINIVLNLLAASIIALFEDTLQAAIVLAVFLPIISDMSGCSGNQAVSVSLRELSLGVTRPNEILRVLLQESKVGLINGLALGLLIGLVAWFWKRNLVLGAVVGTALGVNTLVAVCIGGTVPLLVRRLGYDPALASGPVLTTVTDMCGFLLVLGLATLVLTRLSG